MTRQVSALRTILFLCPKLCRFYFDTLTWYGVKYVGRSLSFFIFFFFVSQEVQIRGQGPCQHCPWYRARAWVSSRIRHPLLFLFLDKSLASVRKRECSAPPRSQCVHHLDFWYQTGSTSKFQGPCKNVVRDLSVSHMVCHKVQGFNIPFIFSSCFSIFGKKVSKPSSESLVSSNPCAQALAPCESCIA